MSLSKYLIGHFFTSFISLFSVLFGILSIVFFIQLAKVTSIVQVNFTELFKLYSFMLPQIFIFTIPISFFVSVAICMYKISKDNESIVLFTLGFSPKKISNFFIVLASSFSLILLLNALVFIPISKQLNKNFVDYKKTQASFNIKASEFGQKISNWFLFLEQDKNANFNNIIMYEKKTNKNNERFLIAKNANLETKDNQIILHLSNGNAYDFGEDSINKLSFESSIFRTNLNLQIKDVTSILEYWKNELKDKKERVKFLFFICISFFPLSSVLYALSIGIVTIRYEQKSIYSKLFLVVIGYFMIVFVLSKINLSLAIFLVFVLSFLSSIFYFNQKILKRY